MRIQQFDFSIDVLKPLLWKDNKASKREYLLGQKQEWININHTQFWGDWYRDVFNLQTANDFGLVVWSIILNLPLFIEVFPDPEGKPIWGFDEYHENFDNGNFTNIGGGPVLSTDQKRLVLKLRYFDLTTRDDTRNVNAFLKFAFADLGDVWRLDGLDMSVVYVFSFAPDPVLLSVLQDYDILPRTAGVLVRYVDLTRDTFGFGEYNQNFDNGTFIDG
jgi:hypothetical protein